MNLTGFEDTTEDRALFTLFLPDGSAR